MVFGKPEPLKPIFFLGKIGFWKEQNRKTDFFLGKNWFSLKNQLFPKKKIVLGAQAFQKPTFLLGKFGFFLKKYQLFPRKTKKIKLFRSHHSSKKNGFLDFLIFRVSAFGAFSVSVLLAYLFNKKVILAIVQVETRNPGVQNCNIEFI